MRVLLALTLTTLTPLFALARGTRVYEAFEPEVFDFFCALVTQPRSSRRGPENQPFLLKAPIMSTLSPYSMKLHCLAVPRAMRLDPALQWP